MENAAQTALDAKLAGADAYIGKGVGTEELKQTTPAEF